LNPIPGINTFPFYLNNHEQGTLPMKYFPAGAALIFSLLILASCQPELIIKAPGYDYSAMDKETRQGA
jgi:hypothetical protein